MLIKLYIRIACNDVVHIDVYIMLKRNTIAFISSWIMKGLLKNNYNKKSCQIDSKPDFPSQFGLSMAITWKLQKRKSPKLK